MTMFYLSQLIHALEHFMKIQGCIVHGKDLANAIRLAIPSSMKQLEHENSEVLIAGRTKLKPAQSSLQTSSVPLRGSKIWQSSECHCDRISD